MRLPPTQTAKAAMARRLLALAVALLAALVLGCAASSGRSASHWDRVQGALRSGRNDLALKVGDIARTRLPYLVRLPSHQALAVLASISHS